MRKKMPSKIRRLLPWYVNGTLCAQEQRLVEQYLRQNPDAMGDVDAYRQYHQRMRSWGERQYLPRLNISPGQRTQMSRMPDARWVHPYAWCAALIILVLLWSFVRPGVVLEWGGARGDVNEFYVYRTTGSGEYRRIGTVPVSGDAQNYTYVDTLLVPWKSYTYVVQGVQGNDVRALSGSVQRDALAVLPVQGMLIALSVLLGYGLMGLVRRLQIPAWGSGVIAS